MEDLINNIIKDINKTGYPTEMKVVNMFQKRKWNCSENQYFIDQDENKGREIDLKAHTNNYYEESGPICCWSMLSVEIKKSEKPWVIFTTNRRDTDTGGYGLLNHRNNINSSNLSYKDIMRKYPGKSTRIGRNEYVALAKDGHPQIYNAILSAVKSAIEDHRLAEDHKEAYSDSSFDIVFYTPVVVLSGKLFQAYLNPDNVIEISPSNHIVYNLNYSSPSYNRKSYLVDIVTVEGLENYIRSHESWLQNLNHKIRNSVIQEG